MNDKEKLNKIIKTLRILGIIERLLHPLIFIIALIGALATSITLTIISGILFLTLILINRKIKQMLKNIHGDYSNEDLNEFLQ